MNNPVLHTWRKRRLLLAFACLLCTTASLAQAEEKWKMDTAFPGGTFVEFCAKSFADKVNFLTEGRVSIRVFQAGILGDAFHVSDTVKAGAAEAGYNASAYDWGKDKASILFLGYAGGMDSEQMLHWLYQSDGAELWSKWREETTGLIAMPLCVYPTEIFLHSRKPVQTLDDLKGIKLRTAGVWIELARELGAAPITASGGDIFPMLERGVIDATEWATPWHNQIAGLHKAVQYIVLPGVHQPGTTHELLINKQAWGRVSPRDRQLIQLAARLASFEFWVKNGAEDAKAFRELQKGTNKFTVLDPAVITAAEESGKRWITRVSVDNTWVRKAAHSQAGHTLIWKQWAPFRRMEKNSETQTRGGAE